MSADQFSIFHIHSLGTNGLEWNDTAQSDLEFLVFNSAGNATQFDLNSLVFNSVSYAIQLDLGPSSSLRPATYAPPHAAQQTSTKRPET